MGRCVVLGCGFVGAAVARQALDRGDAVTVTTRDPARAATLAAELPGVDVCTPDELATAMTGADLVVTYPSDPDSDARNAETAAAARAIAYVSSTAVYGSTEGVVDDTTPVRADSPRAQARLDAEDRWRAAGAVVLRAPGIYGPGRGVHVRLRNGSYRMPGDGSRHVSRIHVEDLARCVLAALERGAPGAAHVVGDLEPTPHARLVEALCERMGLPMPEAVPLSEVHATLRGDRRVDPRPALRALGVTLAHPRYDMTLADA